MTEVEIREHRESLNRRRNFWTVVGFTGLMASLFGAGMILPALKAPGIAMSSYYMAK